MKNTALKFSLAAAALVGGAIPATAGDLAMNGIAHAEFCRATMNPNPWFKMTLWAVPCHMMGRFL